MHRLGRILLTVIAGGAGLVLLAILALRTTWVRDYLAGIAEQRASQMLNAQVEIGALRGSLLSGATIDDLVIVRDGEPIVRIDRVDVGYDLATLLGGNLDFDEVRLVRPVIHAAAIGGLMGGGERRSGSAPPSFAIQEIVVEDGRAVIGSEPAEIGGFRVPDAIANLQAELALSVASGATTVPIEHLSFNGVSPAVTLQNLTGTVRYADGDLVFQQVQVELADSAFTLDGRIRNIGQVTGRPRG